MKKLNCCFVFVLSVVLLWTGVCSAKLELVLAATSPDTGMNTAVNKTFAEKVKSLSNGNIIVKRFMAGALGGEMETYELAGLGEIDFVYGGNAPSRHAPKYEPTMIGFLFPNWAAIERYWSPANPVYNKIQEQLTSKARIRLLATANGGERWLTSNKEIKKLADLKGVKLRLPEIRAFIVVWKALGVLPTPIPAPEIFTSLQSGVIDAQENMTANIVGRHIYEVQKYLVQTKHSIFPMHLVMSQKRWESLSKDQQEIIQKAASEAVKYANPKAEELLVKDIEALKQKGMILCRPNLNEFRRAAKPAQDELLSGMAPGVREAIQWALSQ